MRENMAALPFQGFFFRIREPIYCATHNTKGTTMSRNAKRGRLVEVFSIMGDVIAAAAAVRIHRRPDARTLRRLGIDPEQFGRIGLD